MFATSLIGVLHPESKLNVPKCHMQYLCMEAFGRCAYSKTPRKCLGRCPEGVKGQVGNLIVRQNSQVFFIIRCSKETPKLLHLETS